MTTKPSDHCFRCGLGKTRQFTAQEICECQSEEAERAKAEEERKYCKEEQLRGELIHSKNCTRLCQSKWESAEAECAALREDAERYRWLRECTGPVAAGIDQNDGIPTGVQWLDTTDLDAAIDAARERK